MILILLFAVSVYSLPCSVSRVIQCASTWYDWDHDGTITVAEIKRFMIEKPCGHPNFKFMGTTAMNLCDVNHDGVITSVDAWDTSMSCLLTNDSLLQTACTECDRCDAHGSKK